MEVAQVFARFRAIKTGITSRKKAGGHMYGDHRSPFTGSGYDIIGVDRWRPGQPLKDVAWSLSLRSYPEKLYKIERMERKQLPTVITVDMSSSMLFEIERETSKAVLMLDVIGSLGLTRANLHDPVGLLGYSDRIELFMKPKLGHSWVFRMAHEIFSRLAVARELQWKRRADLTVPLRFLAGRLRVPHSIVLVSDLVDVPAEHEARYFAGLRQLASKNDVMMLILDDPDEFSIPHRFGFFRIADMETGRRTVVSARKAPLIRRGTEETREAMRKKLKRECGVDSAVLTPADYFQTLALFLRTRGTHS